ncbi:MAG: hypothetical protein U0Q03_17810 [Acidimicrobiales bacterium]
MTERTSRPASSAREGVASGSKVAAAATGVAVMLGLVGLMGYANRAAASSPAPTPVEPAAPSQVVVVVRTADQGTSAPTGAVAAQPGAPIVLTAQPSARPAPAGATPVAQTHGSR